MFASLAAPRPNRPISRALWIIASVTLLLPVILTIRAARAKSIHAQINST